MLSKIKNLAREINYFIFDKIYFWMSSIKLKRLEKIIYKKHNSFFQVPFTYRGYGHYKIITPSQEVNEVKPFFDFLCNKKPKIICEIGTDKGGTFYLWCKASSRNSTIISIDLPQRANYSEKRRNFYKLFKNSTCQKIKFIAGNSSSNKTEKEVLEVLNGELIDFLFIDGDHTYKGVKNDFDVYSKYVKKGGLIAFHDIRTVRKNCGVKRFWEEVISKNKNKCKEFCVNDFGPAGAGIGIYKK